MATQNLTKLDLLLAGGWATDLGGRNLGQVGQGALQISHLTNAKNVFYEQDGWPHKIGGTQNITTSALESGTKIRGLHDFWKQQGGTQAQRRIIHISSKVKADTGDGSFADIITGLSPNSVPNYESAENQCLITSDSSGEAPRIYDGTNVTPFKTGDPDLAFAAYHQNRMFGAGDSTNPSRLYYSDLLDITEWQGGESGFIDINPNDGDEITGLASFKNELWIFKGPNAGSIHRLQGSTPVLNLPDSFARREFARGVGCVAHASIFRFRDDLGFVWRDGSVRSLAGVDRFGDLEQGSLTSGIRTWLRDNVNRSALIRSRSAVDEERGYVLVTLPIDSSDETNAILMIDLRFEQPRLAWWQFATVHANSIATVVDSEFFGLAQPMMGGSDGNVKRLQYPDRSMELASADPRANSEAYTAEVEFPFMDPAGFLNVKTHHSFGVSFQSEGTYNLDFEWRRDIETPQTDTIDMGGQPALGTFVLDTDYLDPDRPHHGFVTANEGGEFRASRIIVSQDDKDVDMRLYGAFLRVYPGPPSLEN
jgi:hypothetical protein